MVVPISQLSSSIQVPPYRAADSASAIGTQELPGALCRVEGLRLDGTGQSPLLPPPSDTVWLEFPPGGRTFSTVSALLSPMMEVCAGKESCGQEERDGDRPLLWLRRVLTYCPVLS